MTSYRQFRSAYNTLHKNAAAVLTPEAEQAMVQQQQAGMPPPQDPAAMGGMPPQGMPMDPAMQGAAPMPPPQDPAAMGGMPPQGPAMSGMPPQGAMPQQLPPEIMQDQQFIMLLQQMAGISLDPNSGMFIDPNGQPVDPTIIMQAYQEYLMQMQQAQQGGVQMPPPQDPAAMGGMPPQGMPMDPAMQGAAQPPDPSEDPMVQAIASAVMTGVESVIQEYTAATEKRINALVDMVKELKDSFDRLSDETDERSANEVNSDKQLMEDLSAELQPTGSAAPIAQKEASVSKDDTPTLINILMTGKR